MIAFAAMTALTASAQIGVDAMAKQRARDVANQNNNRVMQQSGAAPSAAQPAAPTPAPLNPAQQAYASFQADLFSVNADSAAGSKAGLARDLSNVAQGAKPSPAAVSKLSDHLATAFAEAKLSAPAKTRLAQDVAVVLNSGKISPTQKEALINDAQSILQSGGASGDNATAVGADLHAVADEIKPGAK
jgi:hypothetical protein